MARNKILTIDDNFENNILIQHFLSGDFDVVSAESGKEGLAILTAEKIDVVLLDLMMPVMNGFEVLEKISEDPNIKDTPVIVVSAKTEIEDVKLSLKKGALDYIKKPLDFSELHNKISIALKIKKQADEIHEFSQLSYIQESLLHARRLQQSLLPDKKISKIIFPESFIIDVPKDIISGDFYWMNFIGTKKFVSVFDSTGHGVPGAMLSIMGHMLLNEVVFHHRETSPKNIFDHLANEININLNRSSDTYAVNDGMDGIFCSIDEESNLLEFASANRPVIIIRKNGSHLCAGCTFVKQIISNSTHSLYFLKGDNLSIGRESSDFNFKNISINLEKGDSIYLFTDGISDQLDKNGRKLSKRKLLDFLLSIQDLPMQEQKQQLYRYIDKSKENTIQTDDILIIGIKY